MPRGDSLKTAVLADDANQVTLLLQQGVSIDEAIEVAWHPVLSAAGSKPDALRALLAGGADPNVADRFGNTPLLKACSLGRLRQVQMLLDAGADPNQCDTAGRTPLMVAARRADDEKVRLLLARGADHRASDVNFLNALFCAERPNRQHPVARILRDAGAQHTPWGLEWRSKPMTFRGFAKHSTRASISLSTIRAPTVCSITPAWTREMWPWSQNCCDGEPT